MELDDHMIQRLDKFHDFLDGFQIEESGIWGCFYWFNNCFDCGDARMDKKTAMRRIKFVKSFLFYYYADWSGVDEAKDLGFLFEDTRKFFWLLDTEIPQVIECNKPVHLQSALSTSFGTIHLLSNNIGKIYDILLRLSHSAPFVNSIMFDEFVGSVQQYIMNVPEEPRGWGRSARNYSEVEANYKDTVHKLEAFRYVISSFSKNYTDKKKLRSLLARAASPVFSILHMANAIDVDRTNTREMEVKIFRSSCDMSRMLSLHNTDAVEVYLEGVSANVETSKASKPVHSLLSLLQIVKTQVHILGEILDLSIMELKADGPGEQVITFLKRGLAVASRKSGSLFSSIPPNCDLLSNLIQTLNLIKGELFVQEAHNQKARLTSFSENRAANTQEALILLHQFLKTPAEYMREKDKLMLQLIEACLREAGSSCDSGQTMEFSDVTIMESSIAIFTLSKAEAMLKVLVDSSFSLNFLAGFHIEALSCNISLDNPDAVEVYLEVVSANVETSKASKPPGGPVYSLLSFLQIVKNQVHVLGGIQDLPIMKLIADGPDEQVNTLLKRGYAVASRETGSLSSLIPPNLIQTLNLIKGEFFVQEVHNYRARLTSSSHNRAANTREALIFLHQFLKTPAEYMGKKDKLMLQLIEACLREAGSICDSGRTMEFSEAMIMESSIAIFTLSKAEAMLEVLVDRTFSLNFLAGFNIEALHKSLTILRELLLGAPDNSNVSTICLNSEDAVPEIQMRGLWLLFHNFPKSDGAVFAQHLLGKLKKLLVDKQGTITFMKDEMQALLVELGFFTSFLKGIKREDCKSKDIGLRVTSLMYQAECIIDMFILGFGDAPLWYHQLVLYVSIEEAKFIKAQILQYCPDGESLESPLQGVRLTLSHGTTRFNDSKQTAEEIIVGFDDQAKTIVDRLRYGSKHLEVVSLAGMAGIGKTTLAEKVYGSVSIQHYFAFHARCSVSQVYRKRELLVGILGDSAVDIGKQDDNDLALKVKQKLNGKRYLIVVDDVWNIEHWNDLKLSFPDDMMGSRILFTTRDRGVARKASPGREPHVLQLLSPSQSWGLLQAKLFQGGKCPGLLWRVGSLIAEHCRGLPLAIVVVAGILKKTEMEEDKWEEISEHLRSLIAEDQERQVTDILEFSYNHLPSYLKPCYLYLGSFLEDQEIPVKKLQWLWMGEGFIPKTVSKSLEETAEGYLVELINRSLVMEASISSLGATKTCRIHDMLRDLCIKKAKEDNFMQLISMNDSNVSDSQLGELYRLCVHSPKQNFIQLRPSASHVHSLLFFATDNSQDNNPYDISSIFKEFKLVRVLDLEPITASIFPSGTDSLICLNYLAIKGNIKSVPSCIAKLWNLETLVVKGTKGEIALPSTLWSMATLRHVHIRPSAALTMESPELENANNMENLTTFSSPAFSKSAEELMKRWVRLRKLRCIFLEYWDHSCSRNVFPALEFLTELESLNIYNGGRSLPYVLSFPVNLKKLTLSRFCLPWDDISLISQLSNLVVLKLLFKAFAGDVWLMTEEFFPKLKVLVLENLSLAAWNNSMDCSDHFPELERLLLRNCKKLVEVPASFGEVSTLQRIEVNWCSQTAAKSVGVILEQQLELGNPDFQVLITPPKWGFRT